MLTENPFTPTFGVTPPYVAGRLDVIQEWAYGLSMTGAPTRASLITGARGVGKTVLLNELEDAARAAGWKVISESAHAGLMERITHTHLPRLLEEIDPGGGRHRVLTGGSAGALGVTTEVRDERPAIRVDARMMIESLTDLLADRNAGLLFSVDEIHRDVESDLRELTSLVQHAFREGRPLAFLAAGLPSAVHDLLRKDTPITFLRRAEPLTIGGLSRAATLEALSRPVENSSLTWDRTALDLAVRVSSGYPYLIQSLGYEAWRAAQKDGLSTIRDEHVTTAMHRSQRRMGQFVHATALADLSPIDKTFLAAMSVDEGPSHMGDIAQRLGVNAQYAGVYRDRLITAEMIRPTDWGRVDFVLPLLREYLRDHSATHALTTLTTSPHTTHHPEHRQIPDPTHQHQRPAR